MFAILFEVLLIEIQEEVLHFAGREGGVLRGTKIVNKIFVNKLAFPIRGSFYQGLFLQKGASSYWCPELREGFGVASRGLSGSPVENEGRGGSGWGQAKEPASQCACVCPNYRVTTLLSL